MIGSMLLTKVDCATIHQPTFMFDVIVLVYAKIAGLSGLRNMYLTMLLFHTRVMFIT